MVVRTRARRYDLSNSHKSPEIIKLANLRRPLSGPVNLKKLDFSSLTLQPKPLKSALKPPISAGKKKRHRRSRSGMVSAADLSQLDFSKTAGNKDSAEDKAKEDGISMSAGLLAVAGSGRAINKRKDTRSLEATAAALASLQQLKGAATSERSDESKAGEKASDAKNNSDVKPKPVMKIPPVGT